jgi:hypothetical protein
MRVWTKKELSPADIARAVEVHHASIFEFDNGSLEKKKKICTPKAIAGMTMSLEGFVMTSAAAFTFVVDGIDTRHSLAR